MIEVSTFLPEHQGGVVALVLTIQQVEFGVPISIEDQPDLLSIPDFYQRAGGNFWVALDGGNVVGSIALRDIGGRQAALRKMFVERAYRGAHHGIGARLLDTLMRSAVEHNLAEIYLGTRTQLVAARRFYEKHDFAEVAKSALPTTFPVMAVDDRFYRRAL